MQTCMNVIELTRTTRFGTTEGERRALCFIAATVSSLPDPGEEDAQRVSRRRDKAKARQVVKDPHSSHCLGVSGHAPFNLVLATNPGP